MNNTPNNISIIANSKSLRKYLKELIAEADRIGCESFPLFIEEGQLNSLGFEYFGLENRNQGEFELYTDKAKKLVKILKQISEQPIRIDFDGSNMNFVFAI